MIWKHPIPAALLVSIVAFTLSPTPTAAVTNNADSLYVPAGQTITLGGPHGYRKLVKVESTGIVYVTKYTGSANTGYLQLTAPTMVIAGAINGDGRGFRGESNYQEGPAVGGYPGGGAGYGGVGGRGGGGGAGGGTYGTSSGADLDKGSGGGDAPSGQFGGGNGGALVKLFAHSLDVSGTISVNGTPGATTAHLGAGGGSGGGLLIEAPVIVWSGTLSARGGNGENATSTGGGGAGGGRIKLYYCSLQQSGSSVVVSGGSGGTGTSPGLAGSAGTYYTEVIPEPTITSIVDVRNDQGRQVRISWLRACSDWIGDPQPVTHYTIWRRIDALPLASRIRPSAPPRTLAWPPGTWDFVLDVPVRGEASYNTLVPTLADSNAGGLHRSVFFVSGVTANPLIYYDSAPDSGYSVDNLPPLEPEPFTASWTPGTTSLAWGASDETDFWLYRLYRGDSEGFVPASGNLIATQTMPGFDDTAPGLHYYKLCAVDLNGNRSSYALVRPQDISGVPERSYGALWLGRAAPNPTAAGAAISVGLSRDGQVTLALYDVQGRLVRVLLSGHQPAGEMSLVWDGRDERGRPAAAGFYVYQLEAEERLLTGRLEVVR